MIRNENTVTDAAVDDQKLNDRLQRGHENENKADNHKLVHLRVHVRAWSNDSVTMCVRRVASGGVLMSYGCVVE